jgi:hypothetical protein
VCWKCGDLSGKSGVEVVIAPFMIIELVRATVKGGNQYFSQNKSLFQCMANFEILELTKVFMYKTLWNVDGGGLARSADTIQNPYRYADWIKITCRVSDEN